MASATRVVVVRHYREEERSSNTARFAALVLPNCTVHAWSPEERFVAPELSLPLRVLHPAASRELSAADAGATLLVPDGTWPQTIRMLRREPLLADATPVRLPPGAPSIYRLRKAPEGRLSTYEAIARAIALLEGVELEEPLLDALRIIVDRTLWTRGSLPAADVHGGIPPLKAGSRST